MTRLALALVPALAFAMVAAPTARSADDAPAAPAPLLVNPSFEEWTAAGPKGWEVFEGLRDPGNEQRSEMAADAEFVREGKQSLRLSGGMGTTSWQLLRQRAPVAPGRRVTVRVAAKAVNVRQEGRQTANAFAFLEFTDAKGARLGITWSPLLAGTRDWSDLRLAAFAPEGATAAWVGFFLSESGTLWFDDVRLAIAPGGLDDADGRAAAFDAAADRLRETYPFFGVGRRPAAEKLVAKWRARCVDAKDADGFVRALRLMLGDLDDLHVWITHGGQALSTATATTIRPNLDPDARRAALGEILDEKPPLLAARIGAGADAVGYVEIASWRLDEAAAARLEKDLDALADCRGLVLDLRANAGGDAAVAERVASRFAAADVVYARIRARDPGAPADTSALAAPQDRVLHARKDAAADARPVAVLQGPWCMSACEEFLMMARALPTVTTVGARSRGAVGDPRPFEILPKLVVHASTSRAYLPDSEETIERRGVDPEVEVKERPGDGKDPVLAAALELVRR